MSGVACPTCGRTWGHQATFCGACGDQLPGSPLRPSSPTTESHHRPPRAGAAVGVVIAGLVLAGVGAFVAGTSGPGEPSVADDEVAAPSDGDGARATAAEAGAAPPLIECRRAGGPFDCARWMRRPVGDEGDEAAFAWATATADRVLVAHGSILTALDRATGRMLWEHAAGFDLVDLQVDDEVVVAQTDHGTTLGLSIHDGTVRWTADGTERMLRGRRTPGAVHTVQREGDELVLTARNAEDGTARWRRRVTVAHEPPFHGVVHVVPSEIVTLVLEEDESEPPAVVALDSEDGTERWRRPASHPLHVTADTTVVADIEPDLDPPDGPGLTPGTITTMVGLDSTDGTERWRHEVSSMFGGYVFREGRLVTSSSDGVIALDLATGEEHWRGAGHGFERLVDVVPIGGPASGDPPVIVSFVDQDDLVIGRNPKTGELVWRTQPVERAEFLTIVDGRIVAGQGGGSVTQLDPVTGQVLVTVSTAPAGQPWFVADDVLVDARSGWVAAVDVPQPPSG